VCDPVPNPLEDDDVAGDAGRVAGCRVHEELTGPQVEAGKVDLGRDR